MRPPKPQRGPRTPTPELEPEPEKEPPASQVMPLSWRHIDISDVVHEQTLLRDSITQTLSDGDVDPRDIVVIANMMKRAGHGQQKIEHVSDALGDGHLDDDDITLMQLLCPPEAIDDWMRILHTAHKLEGREDCSLESNFGCLLLADCYMWAHSSTCT
jgi:hypothetical protein